MAALTDQQLADAAAAGGFTPDQIPMAVAIAKAESSGNPGAVSPTNTNGTTDYGLWQINSSHTAELGSGAWSDPVANAKMAHDIFASSGWGAWSTYNSGSYQKYLTGPSSLTTGVGAGATAGAAGAAGGAAISTATGAVAIPGLVGLIAAITQFFTGDPTRPGSHGLSFLLLPTTWVRVAAGIAGALLLFMGVHALLKEVSS